MINAILQEIKTKYGLNRKQITRNSIEDKSPAMIINPFYLNVIFEEICNTNENEMHLHNKLHTVNV
jgi:hypothetical protein